MRTRMPVNNVAYILYVHVQQENWNFFKVSQPVFAFLLVLSECKFIVMTSSEPS